MRRNPIALAVLSGLLLGLGVTVLLQQFAVWTLSAVTLVAVPLLVALDGALVVWALGRRRRKATT